MLELNAKTRPDMKFLQMDATAMTFPDDSFSVALDKGTLDALFVDDSPETRLVVENYFKEILRTMRWGIYFIYIRMHLTFFLFYIIAMVAVMLESHCSKSTSLTSCWSSCPSTIAC